MTVTRHGEFEFRDLPGRRSADPLAGQNTASSARFVTLRRTAGRTAHIHPYSEEVVYVVRGSGSVWVDGARTRVRAGDVVRIPSGAAHATVPDEGVEMHLMCFFPHPDLSSNLVDTDIVVAE